MSQENQSGARSIRTVGELRQIIASLPDNAPINADVVESVSDYFSAELHSVEAGIPKQWQGVQGITPAFHGLWFHLSITNMEDDE